MQIQIIGGLVLALFISCSSSNSIDPSEKKIDQMITAKTEIQLELSAEYSISVGYGNIYDCQVISTQDEFFEEEQITLVLLAGNEVEAMVNDNLKPKTLYATFKKTEEVVEKKIAPINGFADDDMVVWELISITNEKD